MVKCIVPYPENCTGCRYCELICTLHHENSINPNKARIRVLKKGIKNDIPVTCSMCGVCIEVCPVDAIIEENGVVKVIEEHCTGCGSCEEACPYSIIRVVDDIAIKCDLCDGDPECVKYCTPLAIRFEEVKDENFKAIKDLLEV